MLDYVLSFVIEYAPCKRNNLLSHLYAGYFSKSLADHEDGSFIFFGQQWFSPGNVWGSICAKNTLTFLVMCSY